LSRSVLLNYYAFSEHNCYLQLHDMRQWWSGFCFFQPILFDGKQVVVLFSPNLFGIPLCRWTVKKEEEEKENGLENQTWVKAAVFVN